jgi:hypothetical protein
VSTILKALRRLEEQKAAQGPRPIREEVAGGGDSAEASGRRTWLPTAAIAVGVGLACAAGVVLWLERPSAGTDAADVAAKPDPAPAPPRPEPAIASPRPERVESFSPPIEVARRRAELEDAAGADAGLPEEAFASQVEVVKRPPASPRVPMAIARASDPWPEPGVETPEPTAKSERAKPAKLPVPKPPVKSPGPTVAAKPAPSEPSPVQPKLAPSAPPEPAVQIAHATHSEPEREPEPETKPAPAPEPAPEPAKPSPPEPQAADAPPAPASTESAPADFSTVRVEKTLWHPSADRRFAYVALGGRPSQKIQEGDVVGRFIVSEIQPSGVVFLQDGKPTRRGIGE